MIAGEVTEAITGFNQFFLLPFGQEQCPTTAATMDPHLISLLVTNFRVVIQHIKHKDRQPISIPLMLIDALRCSKNGDTHWLDVFTKHVWVFRIAVMKDPNLIFLFQKTIERMIPKTMSHLFCFDHFIGVEAQVKEALAAERRQAECDEKNLSDGPIKRQQSAVKTLSFALPSGQSCPMSMLDGDGVVDTAWGAFSLEAELRRQTGGINALSSAYPTACASAVAAMFHIMPLENANIFSTYPLQIVLPSKVTPEILNRAANYRQNGRVPSVSWIHGGHGACLSRSSQPRTANQSYSHDDKTLCGFLSAAAAAAAGATTTSAPPSPPLSPQRREPPQLNNFFAEVPSPSPAAAASSPQPPAATNPVPIKPPPLFDEGSSAFDSPFKTTAPSKGSQSGKKLYFIDCRSRAAAVANFAKGGGTELANFYDRAETLFMGLDNIHGVRNSFDKLSKLCASMQVPCSASPTFKSPHGGFFTKLDSTGWVNLTQKLIWAAWKVAGIIDSGDSALVHCTDGWDRTSQVVSLSMILMDPYYRTVEGFCALVNREWLQMGHPFADRCFHDRIGDDVVPQNAAAPTHIGEAMDDDDASAPQTSSSLTSTASVITSTHAMTSTPRSQISPIFVQFIDAVYQVLRMYPAAFEFTPRFLIYFVEQVYNCRFGTFLFNCHRFRYRRNGVVSRTASVWGDIEMHIAFERSTGSDTQRMSAADRFLNPFYCNPTTGFSHHLRDESSGHETFQHLATHRLYPSFHAHRYQFWSSHFCRYNQPSLPGGYDCIGLEPDNMSPIIDACLVLRHREETLRRAWIAREKEKKRAKRKSDSDRRVKSAVVATTTEDDAGAQQVLPLPRAATPTDDDTATSGSDGDARNGDLEATQMKKPRRILFLNRVDIRHLVVHDMLQDEVEDDSIVESTAGSAAPGGAPANGSDNYVFLGLAGNPNDPQMVPTYVPRTDAANCELCGTDFTFFNRRHTCRRCCRSACQTCSNKFVHLPRNAIQLYEERDAVGAVRVCVHCYVLVSAAARRNDHVAN